MKKKLLIDFTSQLLTFSEMAEKLEEGQDFFNLYFAKEHPFDRNALKQLMVTFNEITGRDLTVKFDNHQIDIAYLESTESLSSGDWLILLNTASLAKHINPQCTKNQLIFFSREQFTRWAIGLRPLEIVSQNGFSVWVNGLDGQFGGPAIEVRSLNHIGKPIPVARSVNLPTADQIRSEVHIISPDIQVDPNVWSLTWGDCSLPEAAVFRRNYAINLAASLAQDIFSTSKVIIRGVSRRELPIFDDNATPPSIDLLEKVERAVYWVYDEKPGTRLKLLMDRLSIEISDGESFVSGICSHIEDALKQAQERYGFVILERKDAYIKELRDILKDMRSQADLHAAKIRELLSSLLRDVLATIFLIGVSLMSKAKTEHDISSQTEIFFFIVGGYLAISLLLQTIFSLRDLRLTEAEVKTWLALTRDYTNSKDLREHLSEPLKPRKQSFFIFLSIIVFLYIALVWVCFNFRFVYNTLL